MPTEKPTSPKAEAGLFSGDLSLSPEIAEFMRQIEIAAKARGVTTREGLVLDTETGKLTDATAWELTNEGED